QIDIEDDAGKVSEHLLERGDADAFAGKGPFVGNDEAMAGIPSLDVVPGRVAKSAAHAGHACAIGIVRDHQNAVACRVNVELQRVGAYLQRPLERRNGVLGLLSGGAAMGIEASHGAYSILQEKKR